MAKVQKQIILIDGPQGVGKDAAISELLKIKPNLKYITSYSSRSMRPGEIDGQTHWFISEQEFKDKLKSGDIFEFEMWHGTYRGMSKSIIDKLLQDGYIGTKTIGIEGVRKLKKMYGDLVLTIFITANKNILRQRLVKRGCEDIESRLADYERRHATIDEMDHIVVDEGPLHESVEKIVNILKEYE